MTDVQMQMLKYKKSLEKFITESTILGLTKIPNICDRYMERLIKFYSITMKYSLRKKIPKNVFEMLKNWRSHRNILIF